MKEKTVVRCFGLPYPDYTELNKLIEAGWKVIDARVKIDDHCVYFWLEKEDT